MKKRRVNLSNKLKKLKFHDLIEVTWKDHFGENGWQGDEYAKQQNLLQCRTVGYYVGLDKEQLITAGTMDQNGQLNSVSHKILTCVLDIKKL